MLAEVLLENCIIWQVLFLMDVCYAFPVCRVCVCAISIVSSDFCFVRTFHSKCKSSIHCRRHFTFLSRVVFVPCPETSCVARSTVLYMHTYKNAHTHTHSHIQTRYVSVETKQQRLLQRTVVTAGQRRPHQEWSASWLAGQSGIRSLCFSLSLFQYVRVCGCVRVCV